MRLFIFILFSTQMLHAGIARLPLIIPASNPEWVSKNVDQEMAPGVVIDAMFECSRNGAKIVAVSAPVKKEPKEALRELALGIRDSFAENGVRDVKEEKRSIAGIGGIVMSFTLRQGSSDIAATLFVFEADKHFFAYLSFGGPLDTLELLKATEPNQSLQPTAPSGRG